MTKHSLIPLVLIGTVLLIILAGLSIAVGSRDIPLSTTVDALMHFDGQNTQHLLVSALRVPRTFVTLLCGSALAVAGLLLQSFTRNGVAEPGLLGVSAGASLAVVSAIALTGISSPWLTMVAGGVGAALCTILVVGLAGYRRSVSSEKLILAGVAFSAVCLALTQFVVVSSDLSVFEQFRHWLVGSTAGRGYDVLLPLSVCWLIAFIMALFIAPAMDALAVGSALSQALGVNISRLWIGNILCITLFAGAATAAAGPLLFIGLLVPFYSRVLLPGSHRRQIVFCAIYGGIALLAADILGRIVASPGEVSTGVMMAMLGGPFFIFLARRQTGNRL